jgi:hypothetical protein
VTNPDEWDGLGFSPKRSSMHWRIFFRCGFRQLGDRNLLRLEHLEHAKAVGVSEHLKALGGLSERLEARQLGWS